MKKKNKRPYSVTAKFTNSEKEQLRSAAKKLNTRTRNYVKEKALSDEGEPILGNNKVIVKKSQLAEWYVETINEINFLENQEEKKRLHEKMEEFGCLLIN